MIPIREDKLCNFVTVVHTGSGDLYRIHSDDVAKVGTENKVAVYEKRPIDYIPPNTQFPKGKYRARVKYFVSTYLSLK